MTDPVSPERIEEQVRELRQAEHEMREWAARWPTASLYNAAVLRWAVACREALALLETQAGELKDALEQIAEAREACPIVRRQDYFDATLLEAVNYTVSRLFALESQEQTHTARIAALEEDLRRREETITLLMGRVADAKGTP